MLAVGTLGDTISVLIKEPLFDYGNGRQSKPMAARGTTDCHPSTMQYLLAVQHNTLIDIHSLSRRDHFLPSCPLVSLVRHPEPKSL